MVREENFEKNPRQLEKCMMKQQYLETNRLFDPSKYFGGLNIKDLEEEIDDQRLDDMFEYVSTEQEEIQNSSEQLFGYFSLIFIISSAKK